MSEKTVCFIGHRTVVNAEQVRTKLFDILSTLISNGADTFLFGSRSDFDTLCWEVVTELQKEYPQLKRISYNAPHEAAFTSKEEREDFEKFFSQMVKHEVHYADYEEAVRSEKSLNANKNAYIMRKNDDKASAYFDYMTACGFDTELWLVRHFYDEHGTLVKGEQILLEREIAD